MVFISFGIHRVAETMPDNLDVSMSPTDLIRQLMAEEQDAVISYTERAKQVEDPLIRQTFLDIAEEEKEHALDMAHYLMKRGGEAKVNMIDVVPTGWGSVLEVFEHVYKHECHVSELINSLVDIASAEKDKASQDFLWGFVREQVEEEATASDIVAKLKRAGDAGLFYIDSQLAAR